MAYGTSQKLSFSDVLQTEAGRLVDGVFERNPNIKSYEEFEEAFWGWFNAYPQGQNAKLTSDDVVVLFNTNEARERIRDNTTREEFQDVYGNGDVITRVPVTTKRVVTISVPKVSTSGYTTKRGITRQPYNRGKGIKWTPAQIQFVKTRTGRPPKQVIQEYNAHFHASPRTPSSISTKLRRVSKSYKS